MQTILVTGGAGYVGSGLLRALLDEGYRVICADKLLFGGEPLLGIWYNPNFYFIKCDLTIDAEMDDLMSAHKYDAVIHLAALVGDPACALEPDVATNTNYHASVRLVTKCREHNVQRFAFASTCSNYGKMSDPNSFVDEESPLAPVSLYAELKVKFENYLLHEIPKTDDFTPIALRFSTVYGLSPRMRFDLTVNEFTKDVAVGRELLIYGEQFWRPYCHVRDFSNAFILVLKAPRDKVAYNVFNVGDTSENYNKKMLVEEIAKILPEAKISYVEKNDDPRDYRVNCDKIKRELGFKITQKVPDGIREVAQLIKDGIIIDPEDQRYYNIPHKKS